MTIYFEWTKDISVCEEIIDNQHKQLLEQINKVLNAVVFGVESFKIKEETIEFLGRYIKEHFSYEEEYMKKIGYPEMKEHIKKHHRFIIKYNKIKDEYIHGSDKDTLLLEIEKYVGSWWIEHIGKEDKKYHLYLIEKEKENERDKEKRRIDNNLFDSEYAL
jgi:hemerythrin